MFHHNSGRSNNDYGGGFGGRSGSFGTRGSGSGGRRGRFGGSNPYPHQAAGAPGAGSSAISTGEVPLHIICPFHSKNGQCRFGDRCRNVHLVAAVMVIPAHQQPIKSMASFNSDGVLRILTGSCDSSVKVWNLSSAEPAVEMTWATNGPIEYLDIAEGNNIIWTTNEPLPDEPPGSVTPSPVGMLHLVESTAPLKTACAKRSAELPYTHPQEVSSVIATVAEGTMFVITAGGEGLIRAWKYNGAAASTFEHVALFEGHTRGVTCLVMHDGNLWSGAQDRSVRVWDTNTCACRGVLWGHTVGVTAMKVLTAEATGNEAYIISADSVGDLYVWSSAGAQVHVCHNGAAITALETFKDTLGGNAAVLIGLIDGRILIRSGMSLALICCLEPNLSHTCRLGPVRCIIASLGQSCFASGGDDGHLIVWKVDLPLNSS